MFTSFLEYWNVTYQDLINKPIMVERLLKELWERGQEVGEICVRFGGKVFMRKIIIFIYA